MKRNVKMLKVLKTNKNIKYTIKYNNTENDNEKNDCGLQQVIHIIH